MNIVYMALEILMQMHMLKQTQQSRLLGNGSTKSTDVSSILILPQQNKKMNTTTLASSLNLAPKVNN